MNELSPRRTVNCPTIRSTSSSGMWLPAPNAARSASRCWRSRCIADVHSVAEPDPNLIARAHLRLDEALDTLPPKRWYERLGERILSNFASLQSAPVAAVLLLVAGMGAGTLGGFEYAQNRAAHNAAVAQAALPAEAQGEPVAALPDLANVAGISGSRSPAQQ